MELTLNNGGQDGIQSETKDASSDENSRSAVKSILEGGSGAGGTPDDGANVDNPAGVDLSVKSLSEQAEDAATALASVQAKPQVKQYVQSDDGVPIQTKVEREVNRVADAPETVSLFADEVDGQPNLVTYMSNYPRFTVHIHLGGSAAGEKYGEKDNRGAKRRTSVPVVFKAGIFTTRDPEVIKGMDEALAKARGSFRRADDLRQVARVHAAHKAQSSLRAKANTGITSSADGNEQQFMQADQHLTLMQEQAYKAAAEAQSSDRG